MVKAHLHAALEVVMVKAHLHGTLEVIIIINRFYIALFSALAGADSLRSHVILHE